MRLEYDEAHSAWDQSNTRHRGRRFSGDPADEEKTRLGIMRAGSTYEQASNCLGREDMYTMLEVIIIGMAAYPIPGNIVIFHQSYGAVASTDAHRIDWLLWIYALKV